MKYIYIEFSVSMAQKKKNTHNNSTIWMHRRTSITLLYLYTIKYNFVIVGSEPVRHSTKYVGHKVFFFFLVFKLFVCHFFPYLIFRNYFQLLLCNADEWFFFPLYTLKLCFGSGTIKFITVAPCFKFYFKKYLWVG